MAMFVILTIMLIQSNIGVEPKWAPSFIPLNMTSLKAELAQLTDPMPSFVVSSTYYKESNTRKLITILASVNYGGTGNQAAGPICTKAMETALDRLRTMQNWLPDYDLAIEVVNDKCQDEVAVKEMVNKLRQNDDYSFAMPRLPYMISGCSSTGQRLVAEVSKQYNYLSFVISGGSQVMFDDRKRFNTTFPMADRPTAIYGALFNFMRLMGWSKVAVLSEMAPYFNENDRYLIRALEGSNVSLVWMGKVTPFSANEDEMTTIFNEIKSRDPRIVMLNSHSPVYFACWMHRFGMHGPNYAIFFTKYNYFEATAQIPSRLSWCTSKMLADIIETSFFYYSGVTMADAFGLDTYRDSTGFTTRQLNDALKAKINHPENSGAWSYWPTSCYDGTLFAGFVLNAAEQLLNSRNETLSDWTIGSQKYTASNKDIIAVMRQALLAMPRVYGMTGEFKFNSNSTINSDGYAPSMLSQQQRKNGSLFENRVVTLLEAKEAAYSDRPPKTVELAKIAWITDDGQPPYDSVRTVVSSLPPLPVSAYSTLIGVGSFLILLVGVFALVAIALKQKILFPGIHWISELNLSNFNYHHLSMLIGDIIMLAHVFALPLSDSSIPDSCSAVAMLTLVGYSISIGGLSIELDSEHRNAVQQIRSRKNTLSTTTLKRFKLKSFGSARQIQQQYNKANNYNGISPVLRASLTVIWVLLNAILLASLIGSGEFIRDKHIEGAASNSDARHSYKFYRYECQLSISNNAVSISLLALIFALQGGLLLQAILSALQIKSSGGRSRASLCLYCQILVIAAGSLVTVIGSSDGQYVLIAISCIVLCFAAMNSAFVVYIGKQEQVQDSTEQKGKPVPADQATGGSKTTLAGNI